MKNTYNECVDCEKLFKEGDCCPDCGSNKVKVCQIVDEPVKQFLKAQGKPITEENIDKTKRGIINVYIAANKARRDFDKKLEEEI